MVRRWLLATGLALCGCDAAKTIPAASTPAVVPAPRPPVVYPPLGENEIYLPGPDGGLVKQAVESARSQGLLDVDLGDGWAPTIFSEEPGPEDDPKRINPYRQTFIDLANDRVNADGKKPKKGEGNYLEVFGIPPTLSILIGRIDDDLLKDCYGKVDLDGLRAFASRGNLGYWDRDRARRDHAEALNDAAWLDKQLARAADAGAPATAETLARDPKLRGRVDRYHAGQARLRAVRAVQARLLCEGILSPKSRYADGMFDLPTHEALADWERKNHIFGWGFLGGETLEGLLRPPMELHFETFKRILRERVADAAGIIEDGSLARWRKAPTYKDESGAEHPVPNLVEDFATALMRTLRVETQDEMLAFLRSYGKAGLRTLRVAFAPPPLPPYYAADMDLTVEIDRGDVWYDFPMYSDGKLKEQRRERFPHLTLFVRWNKQRIPLVSWRTTIGSWRTEAGGDGRLYMKYKNSDVGPRVWKNIVAGPVWVPPDSTPIKDLLTRKVIDRDVGPETVVNTDVMGPGFQSAYGLVMAIHVKQTAGGVLDNQIRTHGSVDYTSIARRFSHGCHRLVNNRAVRLFDFVLRHRPFTRLGNARLKMKRKFVHEGTPYEYALTTRGYYYELTPPIPVMVHEGRVMGEVKRPITAYVRKPGVDYSQPPAIDPADPLAPATAETTVRPETAPVLGP